MLVLVLLRKALSPPALLAFGVLVLLPAASSRSQEPGRFSAGGSRTIDCVIEPSAVIELASPVEGIVDMVAVDCSDRVSEGQEVARLDTRLQYAEMAVARARAQMTGEIEARRASLEYGKRQRKRKSDLFEKEAISLEEKEQSETEAELAGAEFKNAQERKRLASLQLWRAKEVVQLRRIQSPIDGVVVERMRSPGERVDEEPILKIAQLHPLHVEAIVPAALFGSIQPGMTAQVTPELAGGGSYEARVSVVDAIIDPASGTFRVRAELPNPDYTLPSGLRCKVRFPAAVPAALQP